MSISNFVEERLDLMLAHPENWGSAESFELQVLLLLEIRKALDSPVQLSGQHSLRQLLDVYAGFLRPKFPDLGPRPLSALIPEDLSAIAVALQQFREALSAAGDGEASAVDVSSSPPPAPERLGDDVRVDAVTAGMPRKAAA